MHPQENYTHLFFFAELQRSRPLYAEMAANPGIFRLIRFISSCAYEFENTNFI